MLDTVGAAAPPHGPCACIKRRPQLERLASPRIGIRAFARSPWSVQ